MLRLILSLFITSTAWAQVDFTNDREGQSFYHTPANQRQIERALRQVDGSQVIGAFDETVRKLNPKTLCSYDINRELEFSLKKINPQFKELEGVIYYIRSENQIDDVVASLLLDAHQVNTFVVPAKNPQKIFFPSSKVLNETFPIIRKFEANFLSKDCFDKAFANFYQELQEKDKNLSENFEGILFRAYQKKVLTAAQYLRLERARLNEVHRQNFDLSEYYKKIQGLRTQYPLRDPSEKSNFITTKARKESKSLRQRLFQNYSDIQIILMGNVVKKLRSRLEASRIDIVLYDDEEIFETITLDPMERFRFAIKVLRKEMAHLAINSYFNGRAPTYFDLMAAAYEIGIIPASELDEIAGLQDLWNPKKSFWDKAKVWARTFSSVATLVIPPPFGFLPALGIVVIEATIGDDNNNQPDSTSLF